MPVLVAVAVLATILSTLVVPVPGAASDVRPTDSPTAGTPGPGAGGAPRSTLDNLEDRFLTTRPTVGATWKVPLPASTAERLLLRTLQGQVNRTSARLYLLDPGDSGASRWIDEYETRGLVTVAGTTDVEGALARFASEASGYVLASESEPWTLDVAATIASVEGAVVATPELVPLLESHGLGLVHDVRGRWVDAASAYTDIATTYRDQLRHPGIAVLRPSDALFDFTVQQGIMTVFTRPGDATWPAVSGIVTDRPAGSIVYGYLSDTGEEEAVAVGTLSQAGLVLVPTDTTRNLSFQIAVAADQPRVPAPAPDLSGVEPCAPEALNVVVGITDGDNVNVPLSHFSRPAMWPSAARGRLPVGWSMGSSLAILAPAAWDTYAREATDADELVSIIGYGYGSPALLPDAAAFYEDSFALMDELGMTTFWSLGGGLETSTAPGWTVVDATATQTGVPAGLLVGYGNGSGLGDALSSPGGRPAFTSGTAYSQTPTELASQVEALLARPPETRPLVSFLSASNWSNPLDELEAALHPFEARGVRFLTPAEAIACMPPAPEGPGTEPGPSDCLPSDPITESGLALISATARGEILAIPTHIDVPTALVATPAVEAGGMIDYELRAQLDLPALAGQILEDRVRPIVAGGYGPELADQTWIRMAFRRVTLRVDLDPSLQREAGPVATSNGPPATFWWEPAGASVILGTTVEDTRAPGTPFEVVARWRARADTAPAPHTVDAVSGSMTFELGLTIGVQLGEAALWGRVDAPWSCTPNGRRVRTTVTVTADTTATIATIATTASSIVAPTSPTTRSGGSEHGSPPAPVPNPVTAEPSFTG
jgi:hypothetical protein